MWGEALKAAGETLGDQGASIQPADVVAAVRAGADRMQELGKAKLGDKTMLDALLPFADALAGGIEQGLTLPDALAQAGPGNRSRPGDREFAADGRTRTTAR